PSSCPTLAPTLLRSSGNSPSTPAVVLGSCVRWASAHPRREVGCDECCENAGRDVVAVRELEGQRACQFRVARSASGRGMTTDDLSPDLGTILSLDNVPVELPLARVGSRVLAAVLDYLLLVFILLLWTALV